MDCIRRMQPTPQALRTGRLTLAIIAAFAVVILALIVLVPGFGDTGMLAITAALIITIAGHAIAYLGQPTLTRYRLGLIVMAVGIVAGFWLLVASPFSTVSG